MPITTSRACVSVVMPAFNLASFLRDSVNSVLAQTVPDLELLVIDDCSTDETRSVASDIARNDSRVRVIGSEVNLGGAGARNLGLAAASGRYVAFLDGDDLWAPDKLERQLEVMESTSATLCYTALRKIDVNGNAFGEPQGVPKSIGYRELLGNPIIGCSTVLLDYDALDRPLMPDIRKRQDFAFWLSLLRNGAVAQGINEPLTFYRVRPGSLSSNKLSAALHVWDVYRDYERLPLHVALPSFISYATRAFRKRLNR